MPDSDSLTTQAACVSMTDEETLSPAIKSYFSRIGAKGGRAGRGASKARTTAQARAAALQRWAKVKSKEENG